MTAKTTEAKGQKRHRILIVDDHPMTRYGIAQLLKQEPDLDVCGEAESAQQALLVVKAVRPKLVVADLSMPGKHGLEFIKDLRAMYPDVAVLVLSMHDENLFAERALRAGARGYIMKNEGGAKLVQAVRRVLENKIYVSEALSTSILDHLSGRRSRSEESALGRLTDREFEVFQLLGQGLRTQEIGQRLHLSVKTVDTHRMHIRKKLNIKSAPELIKHAVRFTAAQELP